MDLTFQVPVQYCSLQHWTLLLSPVTYTTGCCFHSGSVFFILSGVISPLISSIILGTYLPGELIFRCPIFLPFSYCSWGSQGKNTEVVCHSLLQWTTFCQNSPPWPIHLWWPYTAWLIVSLIYTRLWSMWPVWLVFCDCGFHSVCPLMDKDKRLMEASWWERLVRSKETVRKSRAFHCPVISFQIWCIFPLLRVTM